MLEVSGAVMKTLFMILAAFGSHDFSDFETEFNCLQENVFFEARNQPYEGMLAVATVTMNRVTSGNYPDSICEVVHQKVAGAQQFSWVGRVNREAIRWNVIEEQAWELAGIAAFEVLFTGPMSGLEDAKFFKTTKVQSRFHRNQIHLSTIGDHEFYARSN